MPLYMPQDVFNAIVTTLCWADYVAPTEAESAARSLIADYRKHYPKDDFVPEILTALNELRSFVAAAHEETKLRFSLINALKQLAESHDPKTGLRNRKRLLNGVWFTSPRKKPPDRVKQCVKDMTLFFIRLNAGTLQH